MLGKVILLQACNLFSLASIVLLLWLIIGTTVLAFENLAKFLSENYIIGKYLCKFS